ncbi:MAG TPA: PAS domain-containing protein, partial [Thermoanaerobaculia bacterium]
MSDPASPGQRDWLRIALDKIGDAVVTLDAQGRVTFMNPAAERLAGAPLDAARGRPLQDVFPLLDAATRQPLSLDLAAAATHPAILEHPALLEDAGETRPMRLTVEPCQESDQECSGAVLVLREDTAEQRRLEEELRRRAEELLAADRRKDQFLAMLAHELRNPLAPIRNAVELMRQVETIDPTFQPSREMVERQVKHLARLVDDLLDVSRIT